MKKWIKKMLLLSLLLIDCCTMLLPWVDYKHIQSLNGTVILTGNLLLSFFIISTYVICVLFQEKAGKPFFCAGLSSLCMLFALMFSKFESLGRFANHCVGPYLGLLAVSANIVAYVLLLRSSLHSND